MTEEILVFCGWWFSNQLVIVSETHFSCDTVDRGLWLAILSYTILSSLLCPETDRNIRIGKQGYVFCFTDFKKWCFVVSFLTSISVSTVVLTLRKVEFFKYITAPFNNMRTLKFKAQPTNAFFATVDQMCAGSSQLSTAAERAVIKSLCRVQTMNRVRK